MKPFCAAIDWGTSRFRLWLLAEDGSVLHHVSTDEGLVSASRTGFEAILENHLAACSAPMDLPVVICGMAGSRSGWREAAYLDIPSRLDTIPERAVSVDHARRDIRILPGMAWRNPDTPDVMRGEETQLFGMIHTDPQTRDRQLVCMPGTHSKWVMLDREKIMAFSTFMSGELFALLAEHSILKLTLDPDKSVDPNDPQFLGQITKTLADPAGFSAALFALRSSQLLGYAPPFDSKAALSGCIVGLELAGARARFGDFTNVRLLASGSLAGLYQSALEVIGVSVDTGDAETMGRDGLYQAAIRFWGSQETRKIREA